MATTRSLIRSIARQVTIPGEVLNRVNDMLDPDIPQNMYVTCIYAVLDPADGQIIYANAGHNLPYIRLQEGIREVRVTGMPLGLMSGIQYEEKVDKLNPGDILLLYSDGLVEAHNHKYEILGFNRLKKILEGYNDGVSELISHLLICLSEFTGKEWEQEDDITMVAIQWKERVGSNQ
jgi:serine phosphatase RsbU (regulator of sigma subunit)